MALPPEKQIEAFIGAWGIKTSLIGSADEMLRVASETFEVSPGSPAEMARAINALGRKGRKERAARNLERVMQSVVQRRRSQPQAARPTLHMLDRMMEAAEPELIDGEPFGVEGQLDIDPAKLLHKVVMAVINAGHASDLYEFPEVLAYFGARLPEGSTSTGSFSSPGR